MDYVLNFDVIWRNLDRLAYGLEIDLYLAIVSIFMGSLIGLVTAFALLSKHRTYRVIANIYVTIIRNVPLLIIVLFVYFGLPDVGLTFGQFESFIFSLTIYAGAYLSQVFRGGILAIPKGVSEAGMALGMSNLQINVFVILPIMFKSVLPAMSNNYISLFKDASIAAVLAVPELTYQTRKINTDTFRVIEAWTAGCLIYVATCYLIALILRQFERRLAIPK